MSNPKKGSNPEENEIDQSQHKKSKDSAKKVSIKEEPTSELKSKESGKVEQLLNDENEESGQRHRASSQSGQQRASDESRRDSGQSKTSSRKDSGQSDTAGRSSGQSQGSGHSRHHHFRRHHVRRNADPDLEQQTEETRRQSETSQKSASKGPRDSGQSQTSTHSRNHHFRRHHIRRNADSELGQKIEQTAAWMERKSVPISELAPNSVRELEEEIEEFREKVKSKPKRKKVSIKKSPGNVKPPVTPMTSRRQSILKAKTTPKPEVVVKQDRKQVLSDHYKHFIDISHIYEKGDGGESEISEESEEDKDDFAPLPDMSWILKNSAIETEIMMKKSEIEQKQISNPSKPGNEKDPYSNIRLALKVAAVFGRLPFSVSSEGGRICVKRKNWLMQLDFVALLLLLGFLIFFIGASVTEILFRDQEKNNMVTSDGYLEKILLQKHWLYVVVFLLSLSLAFIGSASVFLTQNSIVTFFNKFGSHLCDIDYGKEVAGGFKIFSVLHILSTFLDCVFLVALVASKEGEFEEKQKFQTLLVTRWFTKRAWFSLWTEYGRWGLLVVEMGVYFLARNLIVLVLVPCVTITNLAEIWNFRIKLLLAKVKQEELKKLEVFKGEIGPEETLKEHIIITKCVRNVSDSFTAIFTVFFSLKILLICCEMFRFATAFLLNTKKKADLKEVEVLTEDGFKRPTGIKFSTTAGEDIFEIFYFGSGTILGLLVASYTISGVGETVMAGFGPIRRYGLVLAKNVKERRFIMSLLTSFNGKVPHVIKPGSWFTVDRSLLAGIFGMSFLIFSLMIQCEFVTLVEVPIVIPCGDGGGLCTKTATLNLESKGNQTGIVANIVDAGDLQPDVGLALKLLKKPATQAPVTTATKITAIQTSIIPTTTLTTTTTTTEPPPTLRPAKPTDHCPPKLFKNAPKYSDPSVKSKCGMYCLYSPTSARRSHIYRMYPYDSLGNQIELPYKTCEDTEDGCSVDDFVTCVFDPYRALDVKKYSEVYDCFGNCYNMSRFVSQGADTFGNFGFNLDQTPLTKSEVKFRYNYLSGFGGECYQVLDRSNPLFHPLEVCRVPYFYLQDARDAANYSIEDLGKGLKFYSETQIWPKNLFHDKSFCSKPYKGNKDPRLEPGLTVEFQLEGRERNYTLHRLVPFSHLYKEGPIRIPLDIGDAESENDRKGRLFYFPYAYIHPAYTYKKETYYSVGYHDCFGKKLEDFDDCGGLPFSIPDENGDPKYPPKKSKDIVIDPETGEEYKCYKSWIPGYKCGVPEDLSLEVCDGWKTFLNSAKFGT